MNRSRSRVAVLAVGLVAAAGAGAQINLPQIIQLPTDDFVYTWGDNIGVDQRNRPEFDLRGVELSFQCRLTGSFRPGSRQRDFYNMREFEQSLAGSIQFIQDSVARLNDFYLSNDLDWAVLDCIIPESLEEDEERQERVDRALERAERDRERRRAREEDDD